jgi:hypothetical protein
MIYTLFSLVCDKLTCLEYPIDDKEVEANVSLILKSIIPKVLEATQSAPSGTGGTVSSAVAVWNPRTGMLDTEKDVMKFHLKTNGIVTRTVPSSGQSCIYQVFCIESVSSYCIRMMIATEARLNINAKDVWLATIKSKIRSIKADFNKFEAYRWNREYRWFLVDKNLEKGFVFEDRDVFLL